MSDAKKLLDLADWIASAPNKFNAAQWASDLRRIADRLEEVEKWRGEVVELLQSVIDQVFCKPHLSPESDDCCITCTAERLLGDAPEETP